MSRKKEPDHSVSELLKSLPPEQREIMDQRLSMLNEQMAEIEREVVALQTQADNITISEVAERYHLAYLAETHQISITWNTSSDPDRYNISSRTVPADRIVSCLNSLLPKDEKLQKITSSDIIRHCSDSQRSFLTISSSFNTEKWQHGCYNQLLDLKKFWLEPSSDNEPASPLFDDLMHCLSGGKAENREHLERWIMYKYARPDDTVNIPHINISGIPGENGKGLFKILLKTIFTAGSVVDATAKELINGFNAKWKDAVILVYEEMGERELPENKIKSVTGNPELNVEFKGRDAFVVDANYSILFFDNNVNGTVRLAGSGPSGEDRRYSIMETHLSLPEHMAQRYNISDSEAKARCNELANLLRSRVQVARWLRDMLKLHGGNLNSAPKLHGEDYWNRVNNQQTDLDGIAKNVATAIIDHGPLPSKLMMRYAQMVASDDVRITSQRLNKAVMAELKRRGHNARKGTVKTITVNYSDEFWNQTNGTCIGTTILPTKIQIDLDPFGVGDAVTTNNLASVLARFKGNTHDRP